MSSPDFPCYNLLISIHYALHIVIALGEFIGTVRVCDLELPSRWILSQDTGYRIQDTGYRIRIHSFLRSEETCMFPRVITYNFVSLSQILCHNHLWPISLRHVTLYKYHYNYAQSRIYNYTYKLCSILHKLCVYVYEKILYSYCTLHTRLRVSLT